ncbi:porin [Paraburkholderia caballeronis]|uniref:Outer membrane protein (Porin) n=1 Tax=Paraburkholderia caballeronis TaxID=416943 RepID=A0A1H7QM42_9BURK|nr:porin [Paraburkholderia caballeronis]PXW22492.1 putative porin [Paraburkholderia caballeronis]PXW96363.1 putative porin [Paraburkholderia caballeronis]RAJ92774.1 putative porin [Paraburkholderia caballeronis]TDV15066.1 putative porin [Paraburkholderia caballeronis]TDV16809.1 putative porin [Paraburkholderia caballeronis]
MKKKILTTAILASIAGAAHAQSSVTLYGLIDAGISYVSNVKTATGSSHAFQYGDGVASGSRWGLRGSEDLGGGLKAIFVLESGFNSGNGTSGQGGALFGRQAFVGLTKDNIGSITLGRQYSLSTDVLGSNYSTGGNTAAGNYAYHVNDVDQLTSSRINNSVKFQSANFAGLTFGALYGFSNTAGAFAGSPGTGATLTGGSSRTYSFGANYAYGPFSVGAAYTDITYPGQVTPAFSTSLANFATAAGTGNQIRELRTFGVGGRYVVGPATLWALWTNTLFSPVIGSSTLYNAYEVGGKYAVTSALSGALGYTYSRASGLANGHWNQVNAAIDYALSKRTDVYLLGIYQEASGSANGTPLQAQIGSSASSFFQPSGTGSDNQVAVRVGIRHKF